MPPLWSILLPLVWFWIACFLLLTRWFGRLLPLCLWLQGYGFLGLLFHWGFSPRYLYLLVYSRVVSPNLKVGMFFEDALFLSLYWVLWVPFAIVAGVFCFWVSCLVLFCIFLALFGLLLSSLHLVCCLGLCFFFVLVVWLLVWLLWWWLSLSRVVYPFLCLFLLQFVVCVPSIVHTLAFQVVLYRYRSLK